MNLTLARFIGVLAALGAALTAFTGAATSSGGYKAGIVAALSAIVAVWLHEEHATDRNQTTAAASLKQAPPAPAPSLPAELEGALHSLGGMLPGHGSAPVAAAPPPPAAPAQPA